MMGMRGMAKRLRSGTRRWGRALCVAGFALGLLPGAASATTFSFGTINAGDVISSLIFAPGANQVTYDPNTNVMHVEAYLSTINFSSRAVISDPLQISGITPDSVLFTSDVMLVGGSFAVSESSSDNPRSMVSGFMNGALQDLSIFDTVAGKTLLDGDYIGNLSFTASETGTVSLPLPVNGQLTGDVSNLGSSDADFLSAFGGVGHLNANYSSFFSDGVSVGNNLCNLVKSGGGTYSSQVCGPGYALDDFAVNANMTITPVVVPEPGTALLVGLGLAGVAALRRK
jgi:hypothetical protein